LTLSKEAQVLLQVLGGIATLITTIFAALGLALGVPAEASSSETSSLGSSELGTLTNPAPAVELTRVN